jgi:hypothetical protein
LAQKRKHKYIEAGQRKRNKGYKESFYLFLSFAIRKQPEKYMDSRRSETPVKEDVKQKTFIFLQKK